MSRTASFVARLRSGFAPLIALSILLAGALFFYNPLLDALSAWMQPAVRSSVQPFDGTLSPFPSGNQWKVQPAPARDFIVVVALAGEHAPLPLVAPPLCGLEVRRLELASPADAAAAGRELTALLEGARAVIASGAAAWVVAEAASQPESPELPIVLVNPDFAESCTPPSSVGTLSRRFRRHLNMLMPRAMERLERPVLILTDRMASSQACHEAMALAISGARLERLEGIEAGSGGMPEAGSAGGQAIRSLVSAFLNERQSGATPICAPEPVAP